MIIVSSFAKKLKQYRRERRLPFGFDGATAGEEVRRTAR